MSNEMQEAIDHANDMVRGHYPSHREYKVAKALLELAAARIAYAREFAPNADGEPDVGNIHANIRAVKAELFEAGDEVEKLERALADCRDACGEIAGMDDDLLIDAVGDPLSVSAYATEAIRLLKADNAALMEDAAAQVQIAREAAERAAGWRKLLQAVTEEIDDREYAKPWRCNENAPGHGHERPGIWDSDNGRKAGKQCAWCLTWNAARAALAQKEG